MTSLYSNYKAVGFVTDGNPFAINRLGDETFMTCSIGNCFQVFRLDKLNVCLVSSSAPGPITHLYVSSHETFAAVGSVIHVYSRAKIVRAYDLGDKVISGLCGVGHILLAYDDQNNITVRRIH